jgi:hypothetical protein
VPIVISKRAVVPNMCAECTQRTTFSKNLRLLRAERKSDLVNGACSESSMWAPLIRLVQVLASCKNNNPHIKTCDKFSFLPYHTFSHWHLTTGQLISNLKLLCFYSACSHCIVVEALLFYFLLAPPFKAHPQLTLLAG